METHRTETEGLSAEQLVSAGGLPELQGVPEDRGRAEITRQRILNEADDVLSAIRENEILANQNQDPALLGGSAVMDAEKALLYLRHQDSASWWVAQEGRHAGEMLTELLQETAQAATNALFNGVHVQTGV